MPSFDINLALADGYTIWLRIGFQLGQPGHTFQITPEKIPPHYIEEVVRSLARMSTALRGELDPLVEHISRMQTVRTVPPPLPAKRGASKT